jgi:hypothetical protein
MLFFCAGSARAVSISKFGSASSSFLGGVRVGRPSAVLVLLNSPFRSAHSVLR